MQSTWYHVPSTCHQVLGTKYQVFKARRAMPALRPSAQRAPQTPPDQVSIKYPGWGGPPLYSVGGAPTELLRRSITVQFLYVVSSDALTRRRSAGFPKLLSAVGALLWLFKGPVKWKAACTKVGINSTLSHMPVTGDDLAPSNTSKTMGCEVDIVKRPEFGTCFAQMLDAFGCQ